MKYLEKANSKRQKADQKLPETGGEGQLLFNGYRVCVWDDEKVLEIDGGEGCPT